MFKVFIFFLYYLSAFFVFHAQAQDFELSTNPVMETTAGTTPFAPGAESHDFAAMHIYPNPASGSDVKVYGSSNTFNKHFGLATWRLHADHFYGKWFAHPKEVCEAEKRYLYC